MRKRSRINWERKTERVLRISVMMKAEEAKGRLETHTEWTAINQEAGQWCWQGTFPRLPMLPSELWLSPDSGPLN